MRDSWDPPPGVAMCNGLSSERPLPRFRAHAEMELETLPGPVSASTCGLDRSRQAAFGNAELALGFVDCAHEVVAIRPDMKFGQG
jgi:hypothetical protein